MSFQVTVLKVLAGHPGGCLSIDDLKRAVAILISSGPDWTDRTKRLLIFSQFLVVRETEGWQITEAGRALLPAIENPAAEPPALEQVSSKDVQIEHPPYSTSMPLLIQHVDRRHRKTRRRRRAGQPAAHQPVSYKVNQSDRAIHCAVQDRSNLKNSEGRA